MKVSSWPKGRAKGDQPCFPDRVLVMGRGPLSSLCATHCLQLLSRFPCQRNGLADAVQYNSPQLVLVFTVSMPLMADLGTRTVPRFTLIQRRARPRNDPYGELEQVMGYQEIVGLTRRRLHHDGLRSSPCMKKCLCVCSSSRCMQGWWQQLYRALNKLGRQIPAEAVAQQLRGGRSLIEYSDSVVVTQFSHPTNDYSR